MSFYALAAEADTFVYGGGNYAGIDDYARVLINADGSDSNITELGVGVATAGNTLNYPAPGSGNLSRAYIRLALPDATLKRKIIKAVLFYVIHSDDNIDTSQSSTPIVLSPPAPAQLFLVNPITSFGALTWDTQPGSSGSAIATFPPAPILTFQEGSVDITDVVNSVYPASDDSIIFLFKLQDEASLGNMQMSLVALTCYLDLQATTLPAEYLSNTSASLHGTLLSDGVGVDTSIVFEYGPAGQSTYPYSTDALTNPIALPSNDPSQPVELVAKINGLTPKTLYHYRLKATSPRQVAYGVDQVFSTSKDLLLFDNNPPATEITSGQTAWITAEPKMPDLVAKLLGTPETGTAKLILNIADRRPRAAVHGVLVPAKDPKTGKQIYNTKYEFTAASPYHHDFEVSNTVSSGIPWEINYGATQSQESQLSAFYGGKASLASKQAKSLTFNVLGANPGKTQSTQYVSGKVTQADWFALAIFAQESLGFEQFYPTDYSFSYPAPHLGRLTYSFKKGEPKFGAPAGYGYGQYDFSANNMKFDPQLLWNWQSNIDACMNLMEQKAKTSANYFKAVQKLAEKKGVPWVNPPKFPGTDLEGVDALAICMYNGVANTRKVTQKVPGWPYSTCPYIFDFKSGKWLTPVDNINKYVSKVYGFIVQYQLSNGS